MNLFNFLLIFLIFIVIGHFVYVENLTLRRRFGQACTGSDLHLSKCTPITECSDLIEEFYNELKKSPQAIDFNTFIGQRICDFDGKHFLICCSKRLNQKAVGTIPVQFQSMHAFESSVIASESHTNFLHALEPSRYPHLPSILQFAPLSDVDDRNNGSPPVPPPNAANNVPTESIRFQPLKIIETGTLLTITQPFLEQGVTEFKDNCGISRGLINRVVGGAVAKQGTYPWIAALGYRDMNGGGGEILKFLCAGSLITLKYIVTSAHCINPNLTIARLGAHDLMKVFESTARDYHIKTMKIHDNFDLVTIANDVAVIELTTEAHLSDFIAIICLPEGNHFLTHNFVGLRPFLAGWGASKHHGKTSFVLTDVQVPIVSRERCKQKYKSEFNFLEFTEKLLCAGSVNADACQGDSGSPLMLPQLVGATYRYFLLGIVSYGYECARPNFPGVYTRISSYLDWIKNNTDYN
ncbi:venom peptide isomerase heavy chain-like [Glossina fuscipes fuscipes]